MSADEMFEELGYLKEICDESETLYRNKENVELYIIFDKQYKKIGGYPTYDYFCDMSILKAINKKVEELEW